MGGPRPTSSALGPDIVRYLFTTWNTIYSLARWLKRSKGALQHHRMASTVVMENAQVEMSALRS